MSYLASTSSVQAPRDLLAIVEQLGDADQILNVAAWETVNGQNYIGPTRSRRPSRRATSSRWTTAQRLDGGLQPQGVRIRVRRVVVHLRRARRAHRRRGQLHAGRAHADVERQKATDGSFVPEWREGYYRGGTATRAASRDDAARSSHPSEMSGSSMRTAEPSSEKLGSTEREGRWPSHQARRETADWRRWRATRRRQTRR